MNKKYHEKKTADFENLTADVLLNAVETATNRRLTGLISPLPSYINRVYELLSADGTRLIAKFYRPNRWTLDALKDEHDFVSDCAKSEIPVVSPIKLENGNTISEVEGIFFSVFPKRHGREFEITSDEDWERIGRLVARIHISGSERQAKSRISLHPSVSTEKEIEHLINGGFIPKTFIPYFKDTTSKFLDISSKLFDDIEVIRIHGDCHRGNLLHRPAEGLMVIDFDDMMNGPPVQDIWLLLPDHAQKSLKEIGLILKGYEQFRDFDRKTLRAIEPLRAMRIIYFLAWCSRQAGDLQFRKNFPNWGSESFWKKETTDLNRQIQVILDNPLTSLSPI